MKRNLTNPINISSIIEQTSDAIVLLTMDSMIETWNSAAESIFGYSPDEAIGKKIIDLILPEEYLSEDQYFQNMVAMGDSVNNFSTVRKKKNGEKIHVSISVTPIRNADGEIVGAGKILRETDKQKHHEALLAISLEASPDPLLLVNSKKLIIHANSKAEGLLGYTKSELVNENINHFLKNKSNIGNQTRPSTSDELYFSPNQYDDRDWFAFQKGGGLSPVAVKANTAQGATEQFDLISIKPISVALELDKKMESSSRWQMTTEVAGLGVWQWDYKTDTLTWDERMYELYGIQKSERLKRGTLELWKSKVHPEDLSAASNQLLDLIEGRGVFDTTFRIILKDKSIRFIKAKGIVELDESGQPYSIFGINFDVTEIKNLELAAEIANNLLRKEVEARTADLLKANSTLEHQVAERSRDLRSALDEAREASKAKSEFLSNMSHEIRTPMNAILGLTYLLKLENLSSSAQSMVNKVSTAGESLLGVINDILDISKIESKYLRIEKVPFKLSTIIDNVATIMSSSPRHKEIEFLISLDALESDHFMGDPLRLSQVLMNLISNAIKFTKSGEIILKVEALEKNNANHQRLRFSVQDTGMGIPEDKKASIFEAFSQADSSTSRIFGGSGLGLTISKNLIELMGGTLALQTQVGVGSKFFFDLSFGIDEEGLQNIQSVPIQKILIISANVTTREAISQNAKNLGWSSHACESGKKALDLLGSTSKSAAPFQAILLDYKLPDIDTILDSPALLNASTNLGCSIILMASEYDRLTIQGNLYPEIVDFIAVKPLTPTSMVETINQAKNKLPLVEPHNHQREKKLRLLNLNILVVDDSQINREVACQILSIEGAKVSLADNGMSALNLITENNNLFDVVLMDIQMPFMDGYEATKSIHNIRGLEGLPIIALTAGAYNNQRESARIAGMAGFISKPFKVDELISAILSAVRDRTTGQISIIEVNNTQETPEYTKPGKNEFINYDFGIALWKSFDAYQKYLNLFIRDHLDDPERVAQAFIQNDIKQAKAIIHKLKGASGTLKLEKLFLICSQVEASLHLETFSSDEIDLLSTIMTQTVNEINVNQNLTPRTFFSSTQSIDDDEIARLNSLLDALHSDDLTLVEAALHKNSNFIAKEPFKRIVDAVASFKLREAEAIVQGLLAI